MKVIVFIPSYKRLSSLKAVIYSLLKVEIDDESFEYFCYVINNLPANKEAVDIIIDESQSRQKSIWKLFAIHREKTLPPVINWYSAIDEYSDLGDIVFLNGDDDLFVTDSISYRMKALLESNCDLLLSRHQDGLFFYDDTEDVTFNGLSPNESETVSSVSWSDDKWRAVFIGNNTYHITEKMKAAFQKVYLWCDEQTWLTYDQRTLMYPVYVPFALLLNGGKISGTNKICILRGINLDESRRSLWGVPGWNSGFLDLVAIGVLNNRDLVHVTEIEQDRKRSNDHAAKWFLTFFFDPRISKTALNETFKRIGKPHLTIKLLFSSFIFFIRSFVFKIRLMEFVRRITGMQRDKVNVFDLIDKMKEKKIPNHNYRF